MLLSALVGLDDVRTSLLSSFPLKNASPRRRHVCGDQFSPCRQLGKFNVLLYGPDGSGKRSLVRTLAAELEIQMIEVDFDRDSSSDATRKLRSLLTLVRMNPHQCVVLLLGNVHDAESCRQLIDVIFSQQKQAQSMFIVGTTPRPKEVGSFMTSSSRLCYHVSFRDN